MRPQTVSYHNLQQPLQAGRKLRPPILTYHRSAPTGRLPKQEFVTGFSVLFLLFIFFIIDQSTFSDAKKTLFFQLSMQKSKMLHRKREFLRYKGMDD